MTRFLFVINQYIKENKSSKVDFEHRDSAFSRRMLTFAVVNRGHIDIKDFLLDAYSHFEHNIRIILEMHTRVKVNTCFCATFEKIITSSVENEQDEQIDEDNHKQPKVEKQNIYIHTKSVPIERYTDLYTHFMEMVLDTILSKVDDVVMRGSGFTLSCINELLVQVNKFDPLRGSSYIKLPKVLANKHAIVNVKNRDEKCFMWAILSAIFPQVNNPQRQSCYVRYNNHLNFSGIDFPVKVRDIDKFEKLNIDISVNVYIYDAKRDKIMPLRVTKEVKRQHIHLLLLSKKK